jgi:nucleotide-binding universal stress UspA family protein
MLLSIDDDICVAGTSHIRTIVAARPFELCLVLDASSRSDAARAVAARMTWPAGARAHILAIVLQPLPLLGLDPEGQRTVDAALAGIREDQRNMARAVASHVATALEAEGVRTDIEVRQGQPSSIVLAWARANRPDLILIGARSFSLSKEPHLSPTAHRVYRQAACSVLLARDPQCAQPSTAPWIDGAAIKAGQAVQLLHDRAPILLPSRVDRAIAGGIATLSSSAGSGHGSATRSSRTGPQAGMGIGAPTEYTLFPERELGTAHLVGADAIDLLAVDGRGARSQGSAAWKRLAPRIAKYSSCSVLVVR